jgi:hypothetical protein
VLVLVLLELHLDLLSLLRLRPLDLLLPWLLELISSW